jgi:prevent-host-death family protein
VARAIGWTATMSPDITTGRPSRLCAIASYGVMAAWVSRRGFACFAGARRRAWPSNTENLNNPDIPHIFKPGGIVVPNVSVTSAEFQKNFGRYREAAIREAITITNHGRDSLVLLSADEYRRLKKRDREVLHVSELSDEDIEAIRTAEIPEAFAAFDHELES